MEISGISTQDPGRLVRPFAVTIGGVSRGPTDFRQLLDLVTTVVATSSAGKRADLRPEVEVLLALCARPCSIAELGAHLDLPLTAVRLLVQELLAAGEVDIRGPDPESHSSDDELLNTILKGLRAL